MGIESTTMLLVLCCAGVTGVAAVLLLQQPYAPTPAPGADPLVDPLADPRPHAGSRPSTRADPRSNSRPNARAALRPAPKGGGGGGCDGPGGWSSGQATYYAAGEPDAGHGTGAMGSRDNRLVRGTSVATRNSGDFGRRVCIRGLRSMPDGVYRVDDLCSGGGCRDIDVFVGQSMRGGEGVDPIQYKWL